MVFDPNGFCSEWFYSEFSVFQRREKTQQQQQQTNKHTNKQTQQHPNKQTNTLTNTPTNKQTFSVKNQNLSEQFTFGIFIFGIKTFQNIKG